MPHVVQFGRKSLDECKHWSSRKVNSLLEVCNLKSDFHEELDVVLVTVSFTFVYAFFNGPVTSSFSYSASTPTVESSAWWRALMCSTVFFESISGERPSALSALIAASDWDARSSFHPGALSCGVEPDLC